MATERTTERLNRIMVLVPWVMANPAPTVEEVCRRFAVTPEELAQDLDLLFMCGLPPFGPGDLIEAYIEEGRVIIRMADYLDRPPRLTRAEALALLVTGRAIAALPGVEEAASLRSALEKLAGTVTPAEAAAARELAGRISLELDHGGADLLGDLRHAIADRERLRIEYYSHGRGEMTERTVDPLLVFAANGYWYLAAHDGATDDERTFRLDRIRSSVRTGERFDAPPAFDAERYATGPLFTPSARDLEVVLVLDAEAAWMREAIPSESRTLGDGRIELRVRTAHLGWLVRLLLSAGTSATVREPKALAEEVRAAAHRALARYGA